MSVRRRTVAIAALVALTGVAGSGGAPEALARPALAADAGPQFDPVDFFTDFFTWIGGDPPNRGDLEERMVGGSPAEAFVNYLFGFATARLDSRQGPLQPFTVTESTTAVGDQPAVNVCSEGFCDQFSGFVVTDGRLQTFRLNGVNIDDRLAMPSKELAVGPISVSVVGAFERVTVDELAVVLEIAPGGEELAVAWDAVRYVDPTGGDLPVDLLASAYPAVVGPGAQSVVLQFPTSALGGEVVWTYTTAESPTPVEVTITVDELRP